MGCLNSKTDMEPYHPQQYYAPPPSQPAPAMAQQHYVPPPPVMAQPPVPPFMRTACPSGAPWFQYVSAAPIEVEPYTGFLAGPWAECLCWAVRFEHSSDWQSMPEYACGGEGPAGGVLAALEQALGGPHSMYARERLEAASRLEEAAHHAADEGRPMPVIDGPCAPAPVPTPVPCEPPHYGHPGWSGPPSAYGHQPGYGAPYGYGGPERGGPQYGYAPEPYPAGGPTLLESRPQNEGMSTGGKVALAAAGGVAAGVAGYALATHMDDVGDALGGAVDGVGNFAGEAFGEMGDFVEDMF